MMESLFTNLFGNPAVALTAFITMVSAIMIYGLAQQWRMGRVAILEANLKRQMLDKGLSPGEIEQVLRASQMADDDAVRFTGQVEADKATLVKLMSENDYSGSDIGRVLAVFAGPQPSPKPAAVAAWGKAIQAMVENGKSAEEIEQMVRGFHASEPGCAPDGIQELR